MKDNWSISLFCAFVVGVMVVGTFILVPREPKPEVVAAHAEYVDIGNGISRTDDLEKGVSCYKYTGGSMSCVLTKEK